MTPIYSKNAALTGIGQKERHLLVALLQQGKQTVRAADLTSQLGIDHRAANLILSRLSRKGWLQRLLPGVYGFVPLSADSSQPMPEDAWALAMELFSPCYITGWTAAEHWEFTEQVFNSIALCSTKRFRSKTLNVAGVHYNIQHIQPEKLFGTQKLWRNLSQVLIADPHRTLIDVLDRPELGAGGRHTLGVAQSYWQSSHVDYERLLDYAGKIENGAVYKRLGFTAERFGKPSREWLKRCASQITQGVSKFDPGGPDKGPIITRWNIRLNVPLEEKP